MKRKKKQLSLDLYENKPLRKRTKRELLFMLSGSEDGGSEQGIFIPSPKQQAFARALIESDSDTMKISVLCKKAGVSRESYYAWREKPGFIEWLNNLRTRVFHADIIFVDRAVMNQAKKGKLDAARIVYGPMHERVFPLEAPEQTPIEDKKKIIQLFNLAKKMIDPLLEEEERNPDGQ